MIKFNIPIIIPEVIKELAAVKKTNKRRDKTNPTFVVHKFDKDITHIDDGYYIDEYTSIDKLYNGRAYIDKNKKIIYYYFDISSENGLENKIPYYDDIYLDVLYYSNKII